MKTFLAIVALCATSANADASYFKFLDVDGNKISKSNKAKTKAAGDTFTLSAEVPADVGFVLLKNYGKRAT